LLETDVLEDRQDTLLPSSNIAHSFGNCKLWSVCEKAHILYRGVVFFKANPVGDVGRNSTATAIQATNGAGRT
jgi:hypothetical protein